MNWNDVINYLVESGVSFTVLLLLYVGLFRNKATFQLKRIMLLGITIFSVLIPFVNVKLLIPNTGAVPVLRKTLGTINVYVQNSEAQMHSVLNNINYLQIIYGSVALFMLGRFLINVFRIIHIIDRCERGRVGNNVVYFSKDINSPFSFFGFMVLPGNGILNSEELETIYLHEYEHICQRHSWDILLLQIFGIVQWFNPFVHWASTMVKENHEFLVDQTLVNGKCRRDKYQRLLVEQTLGANWSLASGFNHSLIHKRLEMMNQKQVENRWSWRYAVGAISLLALLALFANKTTIAQIENNDEQKTVWIIYKGEVVKQTDFMKSQGDKSEFTVKLHDLKEAIKDYPGLKDKLQNLKVSKIAVFSTEEMCQVTDEDLIKAEFPGGYNACISWIHERVKYPEEAYKQGIQGKVYVKFVIDKEGNVTKAKVIKGAHKILDAEALRVTKLMPKWTPAKKDGKAVNCEFTFPIAFKLK
ncbi:M56 family peptidase [Prolixibacteraceae bacterium JC049]|nr:M56 family peptidase [Prolixibacteraceae bacterium JC049]